MEVGSNIPAEKVVHAADYGCRECEVKINKLDISKLLLGDRPGCYKFDEKPCDKTRTSRNRKPKEFAGFEMASPVVSRLKSKENGMVLLHRATYKKNPAQCVMPRRHSGNSPSKKKDNVLSKKSLSETDVAKVICQDDKSDSDKILKKTCTNEKKSNETDVGDLQSMFENNAKDGGLSEIGVKPFVEASTSESAKVDITDVENLGQHSTAVEQENTLAVESAPLSNDLVVKDNSLEHASAEKKVKFSPKVRDSKSVEKPDDKIDILKTKSDVAEEKNVCNEIESDAKEKSESLKTKVLSSTAEITPIEVKSNPTVEAKKPLDVKKRKLSNEVSELESSSGNDIDSSDVAKKSKLNIDKKTFFGKNKPKNIKTNKNEAIKSKKILRSNRKIEGVPLEDQKSELRSGKIMGRDLQQVKARLSSIVNTILPDKDEPIKPAKRPPQSKRVQPKAVEAKDGSTNLRNLRSREIVKTDKLVRIAPKPIPVVDEGKRKLLTAEIESTLNKKRQVVTNKVNSKVLTQRKYLNNNNEKNNLSIKNSLRQSKRKENVKLENVSNNSKNKITSKVAILKQRKYNNNNRENLDTKHNRIEVGKIKIKSQISKTTKGKNFDDVEAALAELVNGATENVENNLEELYLKIDSSRLPSDLWRTERKMLNAELNDVPVDALKMDKTATSNISQSVELKSNKISEIVVKRCVEPGSTHNDRLVCVKNNLNFYIRIENDNVNLIGAPSMITDIEDLYVLLQIVDETDLNSFNIDKKE